MKKYIFYSFSLISISCATQLYIPVQEVSNISVPDLKKGREIYINHCASCHQLYLPKQYNDKEWMLNLEDMKIRAKITDAQKNLIFDYLVHAPK